MQNDVSNLRDTVAVKSDQLNADDLLGGPITITVTKVSRSEGDRPLSIHFEGDSGKPYKPCKTMRKVMVALWGDNGHEWVGKSMTLFNDPDVKMGQVKVGGVRISHMSDINSDVSISLISTKGKKALVTIKKLVVKAMDMVKNMVVSPKPAAVPPDQDAVDVTKTVLAEAAKLGTPQLVKAWKTTSEGIRLAISPDGSCPQNLKAAAKAADEAAAQQPAE